MNTPATLVSEKFITVNFGDKTFIVSADNPKYAHTLELYKTQAWQDMRNYLDEEKKLQPIAEFTRNNISVVGGEILYKGKPVTNYVVEKVKRFIEQGYPHEPILNFLNNLMETQSYTVMQELYLFLEKAGDMPITEDGAFLAYRKVDENYMSYHANPDGTHNRNMVGDVIEMNAWAVNPDRHQTCEAGLHFCSESYLPHYYGSVGKVMRVKVFPQHVIAIPSDYNDAKGRCFKYEVVGECPNLQDIAFNGTLYTSDGQEYVHDDEEYDDEEYEFDDDPWEDKDKDEVDDNNPHQFESDLYDAMHPQPKSTPTLDIDIIRRIDNYLERHDGETITLRKINKSLKLRGFTVNDVEKYLIQMGHTLEYMTPHNQTYVID